MIATIRGAVRSVGLDHIVVAVGGVGLAVNMPASMLAAMRIGSEAELYTSLVVREDSLTLYGFDSAAARDTFLILQSVAGVGPRLASTILAVLTPEQLGHAVAQEDLPLLTRVPGIGPKVAGRLVLELAGKLEATAGVEVPAVIDEDVVAALQQLGWTAKVASGAVEKVAAPGLSRAELLRLALKELGGGGE